MSAWDRSECEALERAMAQRLEGQLAPGEKVEVAGRTGDDVQASFTLKGGPEGERLVLEAKVAVQASAEQARELALDALDLVLLEYLESGRRLRFSGVWEGRDLRGRPLQLRGERTYPDLDAQADKLLE
jgi:hypothetical protein